MQISYLLSHALIEMFLERYIILPVLLNSNFMSETDKRLLPLADTCDISSKLKL